jgi:hypothetical protein
MPRRSFWRTTSENTRTFSVSRPWASFSSRNSEQITAPAPACTASSTVVAMHVFPSL